MDRMSNILADTSRNRKEALQEIAEIKAGLRTTDGLAADEAIIILRENIAIYEAILRRFGGKNGAPEPQVEKAKLTQKPMF